MTAKTPAVEPAVQAAAGAMTEREAWSGPGVTLLITGIASALAGIVLLIAGARLAGGGGKIALIVLAILILIAAELQLHGLTSVVAGEARVVQLFGRYWGTIRAPGLHWVNPIAK